MTPCANTAALARYENEEAYAQRALEDAEALRPKLVAAEVYSDRVDNADLADLVQNALADPMACTALRAMVVECGPGMSLGNVERQRRVVAHAARFVELLLQTADRQYGDDVVEKAAAAALEAA